MNKDYDPKEIETKWQKKWLEEGLYEARNKSDKPKYYSLIEFPYPSGDGLHVGHPRPYIGMDVISRKRRMEGFNVLYPIGWDAFGLPTENYALKTGKDPRVVTKENSENFKRQIQSLGISFDWSREIYTTDPKYYKWTQWIFLKFLEKGLAYKAKSLINWCPKDKIGLANEEVVDGKCERCGTEVEQKEKEQWMLAITKYADRLHGDLDGLDFPDRVKTQQRNWIGRKEGAVIKFDDLEIFTTRPDTIFGATFIAIAGEKDRDTGKRVINPATKEEIPVWEAEYVMSDVGTGAIMGVPAHDERDRAFALKHDLPIKVVVEKLMVDKTDQSKPRSDLPFVERNAVDVLVKHWSEDKYLCLKWKQVDWVTFVTGGIEEGQTPEEAARMEVREETGYTDLKFIKELGRYHSKFYHNTKGVNRFAHFHGLYFELQSDKREEVIEEEKEKHEIHWVPREKIAGFVHDDSTSHIWRLFNGGEDIVEDAGILVNSAEFTGQYSEEAKEGIIKFVGGEKKTTYRLRDWVFSRQRYWGEPIPVVHCEKCGVVPVREADLPVELPIVSKYEPGPDGESPLANIKDWVNTKCPNCGGEGKRETDVMPNWAGSSWYYLRYADAHNDKEFASEESLKYWTPVDWYNGGMEHTTLHLLYSRFWHKFLFDLGLVPTSEPYKKRTSHGLILAEGGEKMSKSKGNVVNPDSIVERFGADTLRMYEMFMGPFEQAIAWSEDALVGPRRFIERVWKLYAKTTNPQSLVSSLMHQTIKKVSGDIENMGFNTAISSLMIYTNALEKQGSVSKEEYETLLKLLAPFAPHVTEELWSELGHKESIHIEKWPEFDPTKLVSDEVTLSVQIGGKVRATLTVSSDSGEEEIKAAALALPEVKKWLDGKEPRRVIVILGKAVSIVTG